MTPLHFNLIFINSGLHFLPSSHVANCYQLRQIHGQLRGREPTSVQTTGIWVVDLKRKANICEAEVILLIKHVSGLNLLHCFQGENTKSLPAALSVSTEHAWFCSCTGLCRLILLQVRYHQAYFPSLLPRHPPSCLWMESYSLYLLPVQHTLSLVYPVFLTLPNLALEGQGQNHLFKEICMLSFHCSWIRIFHTPPFCIYCIACVSNSSLRIQSSQRPALHFRA